MDLMSEFEICQARGLGSRVLSDLPFPKAARRVLQFAVVVALVFLKSSLSMFVDFLSSCTTRAPARIFQPYQTLDEILSPLGIVILCKVIPDCDEVD